MTDYPWNRPTAGNNRTDEGAEPGSILDYAYRYIKIGWAVLLVHSIDEHGNCTCKNKSCKAQGKHPVTTHGVKDATKDKEQIKKLIGNYPFANLAVACGEVSGIDVLDFDPRNGGDVVHDAIVHEINGTAVALTGGGGYHYLFQYGTLKNKFEFGAGVDVQSDGKYIVVEPSKHKSGVAYAWEAESDPLDGITTMPFPQNIETHPGIVWKKEAHEKKEAPKLDSKIPEGGRDQALISLAGSMQRRGMSYEAIEAALLTENAIKCDPPLSKSQVLKIARSVKNYASDDPVAVEGLDKLVPFCAASWGSTEPKEREWFWDQWIPKRQTTGLYAPGGTGKSLFTQQLQTCASAGVPFLGDEVIQKGVTLGIYCEDELDELHRRQHAMNATLGISSKQLQDHYLISRIGEDNLLMTFDGKDAGKLTPFWHQIKALVEEIKPALLIIDTAADTFGGNEVIRAQARQYVQTALTRLAHTYDMAVLLCAHPSISGQTNGTGSSGSTGWVNSFRSHIYMDRSEETDLVTIRRSKSNYAKKGEEITVLWNNWTYQKAAEMPFVADLKLIQCKKDFLFLLEECAANNRHVGQSVQGNYAPKMFLTMGKIHGFPWRKSDYERAMESLFSDGKITVLGDPKRGQKIVLVVGSGL